MLNLTWVMNWQLPRALSTTYKLQRHLDTLAKNSRRFQLRPDVLAATQGALVALNRELLAARFRPDVQEDEWWLRRQLSELAQ